MLPKESTFPSVLDCRDFMYWLSLLLSITQPLDLFLTTHVAPIIVSHLKNWARCQTAFCLLSLCALKRSPDNSTGWLYMILQLGEGSPSKSEPLCCLYKCKRGSSDLQGKGTLTSDWKEAENSDQMVRRCHCLASPLSLRCPFARQFYYLIIILIYILCSGFIC